jgi:hypothetical protein
MAPLAPIAIDLCCGLGGWADGLKKYGWRVIGIDIEKFPYSGDAILDFDVRKLPEWFSEMFTIARVSLVVASPPCEQFSRHDMPWTKAKNPPPPDKSIWTACVQIAERFRAPLVIENVRGAQQFMGKADSHYGSQYLWGFKTQLAQPPASERRKQAKTSSARAERAKIPLPLAEEVAQYFKPERKP